MRALRSGIVGLVLVGGVVALDAQEVPPGLRPLREEGFGGLSAVLAVPQGEFAEFVGLGGGLAGFGVVNLDRRGSVGLRFDGSLVFYGHETQRVPLSETVRRVLVDVTTSNFIVTLGLGPQIQRPEGVLRPYGYAGIGFSYLATVSSVSGTRGFDSFASTTNFDDFTFAWYSGGGLRVQVSHGRTPVAIDLGARYVGNGRARYLTEGSIRETSTGELVITAIESETNLVLYHLGVSITIH